MTNQPKDSSQLPLWLALIPVLFLVLLLTFNVTKVYKDDALAGSNQFILLLSGFVAALIGVFRKIPFNHMMQSVTKNIESTSGAILILLFVGALSGTWLISGIIPSMVYYGLEILHPTIFLPACLIICAIISIATGSSWTTSATVGIALMGIGSTMQIPLGMVAGAVISGAYFGDKLSPLSDTTNLAPAMAGTDLFTHIRYMTYTTIPSIVISLILFFIIGLNLQVQDLSNTASTLNAISEKFYVSPVLFLVPALVIIMIVKKTEPLVALMIGTLLGGVFALIFQPNIVQEISGADLYDLKAKYFGVMQAITVENSINTDNALLKELFTSKGMTGMLGTIFLIICAMFFGGMMEAIGALSTITHALLKLFHTTLGLFASTVASCLALNITASDQYLAIVVPGKMFAKAYKDKGLAPENLSRTLEDAGTVTSVLVPHNTCGAYQSGVLRVDTLEYLPYAFFNLLSPFMTILFAAFRWKIKMINEKLV